MTEPFKGLGSAECLKQQIVGLAEVLVLLAIYSVVVWVTPLTWERHAPALSVRDVADGVTQAFRYDDAVYRFCRCWPDNNLYAPRFAQSCGAPIFPDNIRRAIDRGTWDALSTGWNDPAMLSNIASLEIPPLVETLVEWLQRQLEGRLIELGINPHKINDRVFYPTAVVLDSQSVKTGKAGGQRGYDGGKRVKVASVISW
jgi:hypothetical protein